MIFKTCPQGQTCGCQENSLTLQLVKEYIHTF